MVANMEKNGAVYECQQCGKSFFVSQADINYRPTIKYCSSECYHKSTRKPPQVKICLWCGNEFVVGKHKDKKFCNTNCACSYKREAEKKPTLGADGYRYVWFTNGSGMKEHRYKMEQHLGRKLNTDRLFIT